jgi:hypothetical protein
MKALGSAEVRQLEILIDHSDLMNGVKRVVAEVFPQWSCDDIELVQQTNGITNKCK